MTGLVDGRVRARPPPTAPLQSSPIRVGRPLGHARSRATEGDLICDSLRKAAGAGRDHRHDNDACRVSRWQEAEVLCLNVTETSDGTFISPSRQPLSVRAFLRSHHEARRGGLFPQLSVDGSVTTLLDGLYFANGLTVTADESRWCSPRPRGRRQSKYWLGPQAGLPIAGSTPAGLPGQHLLPVPTAGSGSRWSPCRTPRPNGSRPGASDPKTPVASARPAQPKIRPQVWVLAFDADSGAVVPGVQMTHPNSGAVTRGEVESAGQLGCRPSPFRRWPTPTWATWANSDFSTPR